MRAAEKPARDVVLDEGYCVDEEVESKAHRTDGDSDGCHQQPSVPVSVPWLGSEPLSINPGVGC